MGAIFFMVFLSLNVTHASCDHTITSSEANVIPAPNLNISGTLELEGGFLNGLFTKRRIDMTFVIEGVESQDLEKHPDLAGKYSHVDFIYKESHPFELTIGIGDQVFKCVGETEILPLGSESTSEYGLRAQLGSLRGEQHNSPCAFYWGELFLGEILETGDEVNVSLTLQRNNMWNSVVIYTGSVNVNEFNKPNTGSN